MLGWQWHHLDHMQIICTSLQTDNHASTSPISFYRPDALAATQLTASKHRRHNEWLINELIITTAPSVCCMLTTLTVQNSFLSGLQRHLRSASSLTPVSPQPGSSRASLSRSTSSQPFSQEHGFFRMVDMFVRQVLL